MRIALIGANGGSGGLIGYINGLITADEIPEGWKVRLFCGSKLARKLNLTEAKIDISITEMAVENVWNRILDRKLPKDFINLVNDFKPDLVFFLHGYIRRGFENIPNIMVLHNQLLIDSKQFYRQGFSLITIKLLLSKFVTLRSMLNAETVIFLSPFSMHQAIENRVKFKNGIIIPFGIEKENMITVAPIKEPSEIIKMIYISAMYPYKNQLELIKACVLLKKDGYKFELKLVGQINKAILHKIQNEIKVNNMQDNIKIIDWVEHNEIKTLIDDSDIFVYASSIETTGYGLLEGMARGAVIASSNQSGFPDMLRDGGVYFHPKDPFDIYLALCKLINLSNNDKYVISSKALEYSYKYSWEKTAKQHYELFSSFDRRSEACD